MGTPRKNTAVCDRYVSCLCSVPRPDRYTEMKLLKELIDVEDTPLLKTVVGRVAAITCGEERTPIFRKLAEKFGCYRSQEGTNEIVETKEKYGPPKMKENVSNSPAHSDPIQDSKSSTVHSTVPEILADSDKILTSDCSQEPIMSSDSGPLTPVLPLRVNSIVNQTDSINELNENEAYVKKKWAVEKIQTNLIQISDRSPSSSKSDMEKIPPSLEEFVFKCEVCERVFNNSISVDMHKRRTHKIANGSLSMYSRRRLQPKGTSVACEKCDRKYDNKDQLDRHITRAHNEKSTIPCPENCGKMFSSNEKAKRHLLSHKPQSEWPVSCPLCSKKFIERYDLSQHLLGTAHRHEIHAEVGSDQWWLLVYWDKPQDAPRNEVKAM